MRTITGLAELKDAEGEDLGTSDWHEVTQQAIDAFADVTGDHQWIHVDVERAKQTPFGGTIAHGYYTLSLAPMLTEQVFALEGFAFAINYGLNKVRFPAPLPVGKRVRLHAKLDGGLRGARRRADDHPGDVRASRAATSPSASRTRSPASTRLGSSAGARYGCGRRGPRRPAKRTR